MPLLGCIADDFTGATDLASMLVKHGMRTVQVIGVPAAADAVPAADAVVVALKSRTAPVAQAVGESLAALAWLRGAGCRQFGGRHADHLHRSHPAAHQHGGKIGGAGEIVGDAAQQHG